MKISAVSSKSVLLSGWLRRAIRASAAVLAVSAIGSGPAIAQSGKISGNANLVVMLQQANGALELRNALDRLASDPRNLDALIDAGNAALLLNDPDGAIGFFARAEQIDPRNARVKAGLASALLGTENPYDALRLFDEAVKLGMVESFIAADRGLAYDLVGDNISAQRDYQLALQRGGGDDVVLRYALSLGISGNKKEAEAMLTPLLRKNDPAAWRMRAFILAINGDRKDAKAIAESTMPPRMASAIQPFLDYMPRLTSPQQAAAAHFGHFPKAANIGREDPRNAQYASGGSARPTRTASVDSGLIPSGAPLGNATRTGSEPKPVKTKPAKVKVTRVKRNRNDRNGWRKRSSDKVEVVAVTPKATPSQPQANGTESVQTAQQRPSAASSRPGTTRIAETDTKVAATPATGIIADTRRASTSAPRTDSPSLTEAVSAVSTTELATDEKPAPNNSDLGRAVAAVTVKPADKAPIDTPAPAVKAPVDVVQADETQTVVPGFETLGKTAGATPPTNLASAAGFDLGSQAPDQAGVVRTQQLPPSQPYVPSVQLPGDAAPASAAAPSSPKRKTSFAELMSDIEVPKEELARDTDAVDLSKITPAKPRQAKADEQAAPAASAPATSASSKPSNPARHWVQISIGSTLSVLPGEYRRISRKAPDLFKGKTGWTSPLGKTNRILVGPFDTVKEAKDFVSDLSKENVESYAWTSADGEEIGKISK